MRHSAPDGVFISVDAWSELNYTGVANHASKSARKMEFETLNEWLTSSIRLFKRQNSLPQTKLIQIRIRSEDLTTFFDSEFKFDLIYIDGSNVYEDVLNDIKFAKQHIRSNGIICGDDLEVGLNPEHLELAKKNLDKDLVLLPGGNALYPGVPFAVYEHF